ncbi:MAG: hypothetical protein RR595_02495 [Lysinibacillus sp.]
MKKLLYVVMFFALLLSACGKDEAPKKGQAEKAQTIEDVVASVVNGKYDVKKNDGDVTISIHDTDVQNGSKSQMLKDSTKIFAELSKLKEVKAPLIIWYAPLEDSAGNETMDEVMGVSFDAEAFKKVDWINYKELNIESMATEYRQSDALGD